MLSEVKGREKQQKRQWEKKTKKTTDKLLTETQLSI